MSRNHWRDDVAGASGTVATVALIKCPRASIRGSVIGQRGVLSRTVERCEPQNHLHHAPLAHISGDAYIALA
jgi:hypothetical protein